MLSPDVEAVLPEQMLEAHTQVSEAYVVESADKLAHLLGALGIEVTEAAVGTLVAATERLGLTEKQQLAGHLAGAAALIGVSSLGEESKQPVAVSAETKVEGVAEEGSSGDLTDQPVHKTASTKEGVLQFKKQQKQHLVKLFSEDLLSRISALTPEEFEQLIDDLLKLYDAIQFVDPRSQRSQERNGQIYHAFLLGMSHREIGEQFDVTVGTVSGVVWRLTNELIPKHISPDRLHALLNNSHTRQVTQLPAASPVPPVEVKDIPSAGASQAEPGFATSAGLPQAFEDLSTSETFDQAIHNLRLFVAEGYTGFDNAFRALFNTASTNLRMTTEIEELIDELRAKFKSLDQDDLLGELDDTERKALSLHWAIDEETHPLSILSVRGRMSKTLQEEQRNIQAVLTTAIDKFISAGKLQRQKAAS